VIEAAIANAQVKRAIITNKLALLEKELNMGDFVAADAPSPDGDGCSFEAFSVEEGVELAPSREGYRWGWDARARCSGGRGSPLCWRWGPPTRELQ